MCQKCVEKLVLNIFDARPPLNIIAPDAPEGALESLKEFLACNWSELRGVLLEMLPEATNKTWKHRGKLNYIQMAVEILGSLFDAAAEKFFQGAPWAEFIEIELAVSVAVVQAAPRPASMPDINPSLN